MDQYYGGLLLWVLSLLWIAYRVEQHDNDFSWLDMLRDENKKPSAFRLISVATWATTTVVLFYVVRVNRDDDLTFFVWYLSFWSGVPIASKAIDVIVAIWGKKE